MLHSVEFSMKFHGNKLYDFTYIVNPVELSWNEIAERITNNYRGISKIPVTEVQVHNVKIYPGIN